MDDIVDGGVPDDAAEVGQIGERDALHAGAPGPGGGCLADVDDLLGGEKGLKSGGHGLVSGLKEDKWPGCAPGWLEIRS